MSTLAEMNPAAVDFETTGSSGECCSPVVEPANVPVLADSELALMAKALGHPVRLQILRILAEHESCITGDLVAELPVAQSTASEHLRILRAAGLVTGEIEGPRTSYCLDTSGLAAVKKAIGSL